MKKNALIPVVVAVSVALGVVFFKRTEAPVPAAPVQAPAPAAGAPAAGSPAAGSPAAHLTPAAALLAATMPDAQGQPQKLAQWQGKTVLVNFWATWCPPCVEEMPELVELGREIAPRGIHVIGIGIDSPSNIAEFAAKHQITYPLYVAGMEGTALMQGLGNKAGGLPFTVLIGADGAVRKVYLGRLDFKTLRADLAAQ